MKILFDHSSPFLLAHGGFQIQIEQTKAGLEQIGVEVEWMRWWDDRQSGEIIHYFGVPSLGYQNLARQKKIPLINTVLLTDTCNRSDSKLWFQSLATRFLLSLPFGGAVKNQLSWKSFLNSDCIVVGLEAEKRVLQMVYGVPESRIKKLFLGCEIDFINASPSDRSGDHLISVGTICARKRPIELAQIAIAAKRPILFIGKPYTETDPYWLHFKQLVETNSLVRHKPHIQDREELIHLLQQARGFALFSMYENWCIAADEAAACGLPLLLPDQKWARERFGSAARYLNALNHSQNHEIFQAFFDDCPHLAIPPKPKTWNEAAKELKSIYEALVV